MNRTIAIALLIAACSMSAGSATAATGPKIGGATYVSSAALPNQMTTAPIPDPTLNNMTALNATIPEGWKVQGIEILQPCTPAPSPALRAYSPDGLLQLRQEPLFGWRWGQGTDQNGCANLNGSLSAATFLRYYVSMIPGGVHVVGSMPVPAAYSQAAQKFLQTSKKMADTFAQSHPRIAPMLKRDYSADTAALRVQVVNGSFIVEERLRSTVECTVKPASQPPAGGSCFARVDVLSAPLGKLDALVQLADRHQLPAWKERPDWFQATLQQLSQRNAREGEERLAEGRAQSAAFSRFMYNAFQQNMARSASQHAAFMQQQERSFGSEPRILGQS